jgi:drug/metabolite transporter (DMT)-like permease
MPGAPATGALIALTAAASWGGGDFSGGMGVKAAGGGTTSALRVVVLGHGMSLIALVVVLWLFPAPWPADPLHSAVIWWGLGGGVIGGTSLALFYMALSRGAMGAAAAVSGVLAAAVPAFVSSMLEGRPTGLRIAGFVLAAAAIWMIAAGASAEEVGKASRGTMALAVISGLGFGLFFVALRMANPLGDFAPLALGRVGSLAACVPMLLIVQRKATAGKWLKAGVLPWAVGVAVLDTGGNLFFLAATRIGRLDVAAVLSSLYPASTILLAAWRLHERPTRMQLAGMGVALAAVVMITV